MATALAIATATEGCLHGPLGEMNVVNIKEHGSQCRGTSVLLSPGQLEVPSIGSM